MDIRIGLSLGGNQVVTARLLERVVEIYSRLSPRTVVCSFVFAIEENRWQEFVFSYQAKPKIDFREEAPMAK